MHMRVVHCVLAFCRTTFNIHTWHMTDLLQSHSFRRDIDPSIGYIWTEISVSFKQSPLPLLAYLIFSLNETFLCIIYDKQGIQSISKPMINFRHVFQMAAKYELLP